MHHAILADVGVPMIVVEWPLMFCGLLPVIAIEAEVARRQLSLPFRKTIAASAKANVFSTLIGVPFAWIIMFAIELGTMFALTSAQQKWHWRFDSPVLYLSYILGVAWTGPPTISIWPIALAAALLLVPTFFMSVWLERPFYRRSLAVIDAVAVNRCVWFANLCSYSLLFVTAIGWFGWEMYKGPTKAPAVKRAQEHPVDVAYLNDIAIPEADDDVRPTLTSSVEQLETCVADLERFMGDVERGKIAVVEHLNTGRWQSNVERSGASLSATYVDKLGPATHMEKFQSYGPMMCRFEFNSGGYVKRAEMLLDNFEFDDQGRLKHWHRDKLDYWGDPSEPH